ncbi:MAG: class I SAM-dependent DNA methyltransferase [Actinomycetota bacterium]|nr:class I SAM-dependent DNA methyltransferase [Actinomycetota bacterium]
MRALFTDPDSLRPGRTTESITEEAAGKFAILADGLRSRGHDPHQASHFLNRLLFCLFAEDVGLLPRDLFTRVVERTGRDPELFARYASELFGAMASGGDFLLEEIRHFNGGLFEDAEALPLEAGELRVLIEAARLDWQSVEPAIFGTLFERSMDPTQRAKLGAHYTSREDILAVVEPVLMAPLRREWDEVRARAGAEAEKVLAESGRKAQNALRRAEELLYGFAERLRRVKVLDPACGSGNFLYVALKELLDLEKEVSTFAGTIGLTPFFPGVSPDQLYGIETSPYAHELAQVVVWIGYLQWTVDNGFGTRGEPILGTMTNIVEMDAILARNEDGTLTEPEWPEADVIVGNPPFLGDKKMRKELGDEYVDDMRRLYSGRLPGQSDLVCYWFERARQQIRDGQAARAGLIATQGIRGGANRRALERIKESGDIFWAQSDRNWVQNGATVHVSMVGFDNGMEAQRELNGNVVLEIAPNLVAAYDLTIARRLVENFSVSFVGPSPHGAFDIGEDTAEKMLSAPLNVNGRPNTDVVRRVATAVDLTKRSRRKWTVDFGLMTSEEAAQYEAPFEYVKREVYPVRVGNRRAAYAEKWWQYAEPRPGMRKALKGKVRYIATPRVSKHRVFVWLTPDILANDGTIVFASSEDYVFGILHSKMHELWARGKGTQLREAESGFRYTPSTTFETFPFPKPTDEQREEIARAAKHLDELRRNWLNPEGTSEAELKKRTLTNLYNARPTWLQNAHDRLDRDVFSAYGWPEGIGDEEILKNLLALNLERSS